MSIGTFEAPPAVLILLAHEVRWQLLRALAISDYRVNELVQLVGRPLNLVSYHLKQLRLHQLVSERRSSADARDVYYHLDLERLHSLYLASADALHPAITSGITTDALHTQPRSGSPTRILFLCTHNSARSQMAEGIARSLGAGYIESFSGGTIPSSVHPNAVRALDAMQIDIRQQTSKHLDQFADQAFNYIITVCDRVQESCPVFPNDPKRIHWSFPDPSAVVDPEQQYQQFRSIARELSTRVGYLLTAITRQQAAPTLEK